MRFLRNLIRAHPFLAHATLAMALCLKVLVPSGFMISASSKSIIVGLCSGRMDAPKATTITIPMGPKHSELPDQKSAADAPCAFSVLSMATTGSVDLPLLALALAFILSMGFVARNAIARITAVRWLPPSQGPPARA